MKKHFAVAALVTLMSAGFVTAEHAQEILNASGVKGGVIVHLGCGNGELTAALHANDRYLVHGLDADAKNVAEAREYIKSLGIYGKVSVDKFDGKRLPYADNLVNLLVAKNPGKVSIAEVMRVLRPGGTAIINGKKTIKDRPAEIDEWTHWLYDASGNAVGRDKVVGPPRRLQWMARPFWARLHDAPSSTSAMVSSNGRVFYISDEGPSGTYEGLDDKWFLVARDAFNGMLLWKRRLPEWGWKQWTSNWHARNNQPFQLPKRLVAVGDKVYVTLSFNGRLSALDAATGEVVKTYKGTENVDEILFHEGLLVLGLNNTRHEPGKENPEPIKKSIAVLKADTGEMLFRKGEYTGLNAKTDSMAPVGRLELAVGDGQIFFSDHDALVSLELTSGKELWRIARPGGGRQKANFNTQMGELCTLVYNKGVVLFAQPEGTLGFHSCPGTLYAFSAKDGGLLWKRPYGGWVHNTQPNVFVIDGLVWIHEHQETEMKGRAPRNPEELAYAVVGLEIQTGQERRRYSTREIFNVGHHHRCYRNKATETFLLTSRRGVEFTNVETGRIYLNHWTRGDCHIGVMPCNGLLYTTPHPCSCYIDTKLNGFYCMSPGEGAGHGENASRQENFVKGSAYKKIVNTIAEGSEGLWSTFRSDARRSGWSKTAVSGDLKERWKRDIGGRIGPVTVADKKVFVPVIDEHRIVSLESSTGKKVWDFTAGGRIDTPPTLYEGMALFGSSDGWVYCVRSSDGALVWARRVAPEDRLIGVMGQLESAWPVHGSVLMKDGAAYLTAGRSSYLDGGIHFYALRPETGEVLEHYVEYSADPETDKMPAGEAFTVPGMLSDILVSDGQAVWMRRNKVFGENKQGQSHVFATGGFRDDTWFNRTTWSVGNAKHAQLLVFDDSSAYGIEAFRSTSRAKPFTAASEGYHLFAQSLKGSKSGRTSGRKKKDQGRDASQSSGWSKYVPVRGTSMALAGEVVFVAGVPDTIDPADPLASFEGRRGGLLYAISADDGNKLAEYKLEAPPVFDGMAAANGRLYISCADGSVICFSGK